MQEAVISGPVRRNDRGPEVKRVQEWLCLRGFGVKIDGELGPATEAALRAFQAAQGLPQDGIVSAALFAALTRPLTAVLQPIAASGRRLAELTVAYARQHLAQHPREVGGPNRGPWVRLYMNGKDGAPWLWCAGFVSFVIRQAAATLNVEPPLRLSFSCDLLAVSAQKNGLFLAGDDSAAKAQLEPGSLFLERRHADDWKHVGIVTSVGPESFTTIEGNTNDEGSRNGYEVAANTRAFVGRDFILLK